MWLVRRCQRVQRWVARRSWRAKLLLGAALFTAPCWGGCAGLFLWHAYLARFVYTDEDRAFIRGEREQYSDAGGLPSVARRLKAEMEPIPDPDTALRLHPDWAAARLGNGEWIFGHGIDSHGLAPGRGTLVVKDSRGRVRIFFGHVCGTNGPIGSMAPYWNLDAMYPHLTSGDVLREWVPNP
jgi:hypothetical protein